MQKTVVIIGGGVAGISAAVEAIQKGWKPILLESTDHLGGRTRSLFARDVQNQIDNGQHVLSSNYEATRQLLARLGSINKVDFQEKLQVYFRFSLQRQVLFQTWSLPSPFHFLLPLIFKFPLRKSDRKFLYRWMWSFRRSSPQRLRLFTIREWLKEAGRESPRLEMTLWSPLTLATLNTPIESGSAFLLYQVLQKAFIGRSKSSGLGLPKDMLSNIFAEPARVYIKNKGGKMRFKSPVKRLLASESTVDAVELQNSQVIETPYLISAVPPNVLSTLLSDSENISGIEIEAFKQFEYSPIITINLWFRNLLPGYFPVALIDSPIQWIFKLPHQPDGDGLHGYAMVISAAAELVERSKEEILQIVDRQMHRFFGKGVEQGFELVNYKIVKEKFATILQTPQSLKWRPEIDTAYQNFFLAGDWVDTDLPATIESAVLSGKQAVARLPQAGE